MQIPDEIYQTVRQSMPIACVDLIVFNPAHDILLVRRTNEPACGQWWLPGGRIHFGETREAAVQRQLRTECGLDVSSLEELWTVDVILPIERTSHVSHGITTVYSVVAKAPCEVTLDLQASEFEWRPLADWRKESLHPVVQKILADLKAPTFTE
jgi:ADP-ribose pyrophosphatase YjhB (NUDIX family)